MPPGINKEETRSKRESATYRKSYFPNESTGKGKMGVMSSVERGVLALAGPLH